MCVCVHRLCFVAERDQGNWSCCMDDHIFVMLGKCIQGYSLMYTLSHTFRTPRYCARGTLIGGVTCAWVPDGGDWQEEIIMEERITSTERSWLNRQQKTDRFSLGPKVRGELGNSPEKNCRLSAHHHLCNQQWTLPLWAETPLTSRLGQLTSWTVNPDS